MIAQSYINPCKYGEYTVALALRVISMWFLKCPIPCRMDLVHLLMKGFQYNILKDNEPNLAQLTAQKLSSTDNSKFNHQQLGNDSVIFDPNDKEKSKIELVEVCMDMLASNAFTTSSPLPLKPTMIEKLLNKDKTQYWMIGHKIIQITTTGCTSRAMRNGLCNKCYTICHMNRPHKSTTNNSLNSLVNNWNEKFSASSDLNTAITSNFDQHSQQTNQLNLAMANRRRHRSEINHSTRMNYSNYTNDDYFNNHQQQPNMISGSFSNESDSNVVSKYCRCWCQTWAEILIRRATGTTRLILRVENNLGEFPNWTSSKHEDDSLAQLFEDLFPDLDIESKNELNNENTGNNEISTDSNQDDAKSDSGTISSLNDQHQSQQQQQQQQKAKTSQPVSRAASFGGSRTLQTHNTKFFDVQHRNCDAETVKYHQHHVRKLEKDFSFEENTSEGSQTSLVSSGGSGGDNSESQQNFQPATMFRDRGHTISVMTPVQKSSSSSSALGGGHHSHSQIHESSSISASNMSLSSRQPFSPAGLSPQFVFLQLYYNSMFKDKICHPNSNEKPIQLDRNEALKLSLGIFDRITPYETHKIGILYVGPGQTNNRADILANQIGSYRYAKFLKDIGQLISLEDIDPRVFYVGGLGVKDGPYAISWCDHLVQMIFHVATMMPTLPNDPKCNNKMAHIGNDLVCIVYNNSGENFDLFALKVRSL
ncbi:tuberin-like protein [Euroglyphus maynei]|uniref:Tuberin-like protein n=1 Tax=Euroglyphus maynei TaxID=6958 RepID=A0A1Y3B841_EURMA|nr:tuberin-like protein [Euroglyphus maynei]